MRVTRAFKIVVDMSQLTFQVKIVQKPFKVSRRYNPNISITYILIIYTKVNELYIAFS